MAVPTILTVTPDAGHSGGRTLIEITGTNFKLPDPPPATGKTTAPPPTVQVLFGTKLATAVAVTEAGQLYCLTPINDPGTVSVTVRNVDAAGVLIGAETATLADAYTYARPDLTQKGNIARALEAFIVEIRRQITPNCDWAVHTDFDDTTGDGLNVAYQGRLPSLVLADLQLPDKSSPESDTYTVEIDATTFVERRAPVIVDAVFSIVGVSDNLLEMLSLLEATKQFFALNGSISVDRDPADPSHGAVEYVMRSEIGAGTKTTRQNDNNNIMSFTGSVTLEQIRSEDMPGVTRAAVPGVPAWYPHQGTVRFGWTADSVVVQRGPKT